MRIATSNWDNVNIINIFYYFHFWLVRCLKIKYNMLKCTNLFNQITDPLHKWRLNLNNNTLYILSLVLTFPDKRFFTRMQGLGCIKYCCHTQIRYPIGGERVTCR